MSFYDRIEKIVYTDFLWKIDWQPYVYKADNLFYFNYKGNRTKIFVESDLYSSYQEVGIEVRPLSDLIDGNYIKELVELSPKAYLLNGEICQFPSKNSAFFLNNLGSFLGVPKYQFNHEKAKKNKYVSDKEILFHLLKNYKKYNGILEELERKNIPKEVYYARLRLGWSIEKAKNTPVKKLKSVKDHKGNTFSSKKEMLEFYGVSGAQFFRRMKKNLSLEDCLKPTKQKYNSSKKMSSKD